MQSPEYKKVRTLGKGNFGKALLVESSPDYQLHVLKSIDISKMETEGKRKALAEAGILEKL